MVAAKCVEKIVGVEWEDFGMPEALWILKVKEFGPVIVNIDAHGGNMIADNKELFEKRRSEQSRKIAEKLSV